MIDKLKIFEEVEQVYTSIERRIEVENVPGCKQCGSCCDFGKYGHRLYISTPELMYFRHYVPKGEVMNNGTCPYQIENKCTVHKYRFAGCRVFCCRMGEDLQSEMSEFAIRRFREICDKYDIAYQYCDLEQALKMDV